MADKVLNQVQKSLIESLINTSQIFYLRSYHLDIDTRMVSVPSMEAFKPEIECYCENVSKLISFEAEKTPLYNLYKTWLKEEELLQTLQDVSNTIKPDDILGAINPEATMPEIKSMIQYTESHVPMMAVPHEMMRFTAYQFMANYLYHNSHVRVEITPARLINSKYYLNTDPTNVLVFQVPIPNSWMVFNKWLYDRCVHVMDTVNFVTTAKNNDDPRVIKFNEHSGNVLHDVHFGMYVR